MRGRKPKPIETHKLNGNPSRLNLDKKIKMADKLSREVPDPPEYLDDLAKEHWKKIVPELKKMGTLAAVDIGAVEAACTAYSNMVHASKELKLMNTQTYKTKSGALQQVPQVGIFNTSASLYKSYCAELGLTPAARTRVSPDMDGDDEEDEDAQMNAVLNGRREIKRAHPKLKKIDDTKCQTFN